MITLGERLAMARQVRRKSQTDVAKAIDVPRQMVGHFETNKAAPTDEQRSKIEKFLYLSLDDPRLISLLKETQAALPQAA